MKKIILFLLVLFSLNINVDASTQDVYYSDYSDFSEFVDAKIDGSELVDVETERRYRWYKENVTGEYLLYDDGINKYESVDLKKFKETEFTEWSLDRPINITDRIIEEKEEYKVKRLKPIQTLVINEFEFSKDIVDLGELEIYIDNKKVDYDVIYGSATGTGFYEDGMMLIDFYEPYYMKNMTIKFNGAEKEYINSFTIYAVEPMILEVPSNVFATYTYVKNNESNINITEDGFVIKNPKYEEEVIYEILPNISSLDYVEAYTKYRYKDKYYYFYNTKLEYADGYHVDYLNYIKDEGDYKDFYRYRTREKIVIEDKMTITRYKDNLEDFIVSTTSYEIESDINYLENGVYSVRYITPFRTINKEVTVDIEENDLRKELEETKIKYDSLLNTNSSNEQKLNELKNEYVLLENEMVHNKNEYQKLLNEYNELQEKDNTKSVTDTQDIMCSSQLKEMTLRNEDNEKKLKLSNQAYEYLEKTMLDVKKESINVDKVNIISFILLGVFIVLLLAIIIKKMSSKN